MKKTEKLFLVFCTIFASLHLCMQISAQEELYVEILMDEERIVIEKQSDENSLLYHTHLKQDEKEVNVEEISKVIYVGYNYSDKNEDAWYYATQLFIYEIMGYEFEVSGFPMYDFYYHKLKEEMENLYALPSFHEKTLVYQENLQIVDENGVLNYFVCEQGMPIEMNQVRLPMMEESCLQLNFIRTFEEQRLPLLNNRDGVYVDTSLNNVKSSVTIKKQLYGSVSLKENKEVVVGTSKNGEGILFQTKIQQKEGAFHVYAKEDIYDVGNVLVYAKNSFVGSVDTEMSLLPGLYYAIHAQSGKYLEFIIEENKETTLEIHQYLNTVNIHYLKKFEESKFQNISPYQTTTMGIFNKNDIVSDSGNIVLPKDSMLYSVNLKEDNSFYTSLKLCEGMYYVKELKIHDSYEKDENIYEFYVDADTFDIYLESNSFLKRKDFVVYGMDEESVDPLNTTFALLSENDEVVETFTTGKDGKVVLENLEATTYYLKEIETEEGYKISGEKKVLNVEEEEVVVEKKKVVKSEIVPMKQKKKTSFYEGMLLSSLSCFYFWLIKKLRYSCD